MDNTPPSKASGVSSRVAAARVLAAVFEQKLTLDEALDKIGAKQRLSDQDRRLVHAISGFVFRNLKTIDRAILTVMNRKRAASPVLLHQLLRVGVAQILYMDVAVHGAVHATVSAAGSLHLGRQKSLVNAVLRSVQRQMDTWTTSGESALRMLPEWLQTRWIRHYGEEEAERLAASMRQEAPVDITLKDPKVSLEEMHELKADILCTGSLRVRHGTGHVTSWPLYEEGAWWVQDLAAFLPINMLDDVAGKSVLDMCAAPGGKTMQLAAKGAKVTALDVSASRLQRVNENLSRVSLAQNVQTVVADALSWQPESCFDVVVCDAPCTSTGTLRRHPELPWNHEENLLDKTIASQRAMLRRASKMLQSAGRILYCTCSMEPEEGENQVEEFLAGHKDFKELSIIPSSISPFLKRGLRNIGWRTNLDALSDKGGIDGFFMALLEKQ